jgi:hypothetical protein
MGLSQMTVSANNAVDIKALVYALTQQREPLPQPLQHSLQEAGRAFQQSEPDADYQLRARIESYGPLESAYRSALETLDRQYESQERIKSLSASFADGFADGFANGASLDWFFVHDVIPAADWVATAKQVLAVPRSPATKSDPLWEKLNRIAVMTIGGASLGAAIAQLPGAIIFGLSALLYGWYISFLKKSIAKNL